jgi:hypothetical protein
MGTAKIAPGTPHIQNQNTSDKMTSTGFSVKCRASSMGVSASPSRRWIRSRAPAAAKPP